MMIVPGCPNAVMMCGGGDPLDEFGKIDRSVRLRPSASACLSRTPSVGGNRKTWLYRQCIKRSSLANYPVLISAGTDANNYAVVCFYPDGTLVIKGETGAGVVTFNLVSPLFRDVSAHLDIVIGCDTTQAVASNRFKLEVNGKPVALTGSYPALNHDTWINTGTVHRIGSFIGIASYYGDGYYSVPSLIDGYPAGITSGTWASANLSAIFGRIHPRTNQWRPKTKDAIRAAVAAGVGVRNGWGTNGFLLPFDDASSATTIGYDRSQSDTDTTGNNFTATNISVTAGATYDSMLDTPTNNYATLNLLDTGASCTLSNGNLAYSCTSSGTISKGTMVMTSGKWYWEVTVTLGSTNVGVCRISTPPSSTYMGSVATSYGYSGGVGNKWNNGSSSAYGAAYTVGDVIGVALDLDAGNLTFYKNGVSQGVAFSGLSGDFCAGVGESAGANAGAINFGQRSFAYTPPTGFKALCTKNLPIQPIGPMKSSYAFVAITASGANIAANLAAARAGWPAYIDIIKRRDPTAEGWRWMFSDDPGYYMDSSAAAAKAAVPAFGGTSYVGYSLKVAAANGVATGRLTHVNGVADVVSDGLSNARKMVILVNEAGSNWPVYHPDLTAGKLLYLNNTTGETTDATISSVTASGFTVAAALPSGTYRWIALADTPDFLRVGKRTGNNLADGSFGMLGFSPALDIERRVVGGTWNTFDIARNPNNAIGEILYLEKTNGGASIAILDHVSNGVKVRIAGSNINEAEPHVFVAFAAFPFRYANAR